ncbi:MAG: hypothetical protein IKQ59_14160 [Prevotella sp.]|nr:hypothetical protein [Prevotella sp.]
MIKKFFLLIVALLVGNLTTVEAKIFYVPLYIIDTQTDVKEQKRAPSLPLFITQDDHKLILPEVDDSVTFMLLTDNTCVYEEACQQPQPPIYLPTMLTGDFEVRLCTDTYYYSGYLTLECEGKVDIPNETEEWSYIVPYGSELSQEDLLNNLMGLNVVEYTRKYYYENEQRFIGMLHDEVKAELPQVTDYSKYNEKGINLYGLISVLVGCIQELKYELDSRTMAILDAMSRGSFSSDVSSVRAAIGNTLLSAAATTVSEPAKVRYHLTDDVSNAYIAVTDMGGRVVTRVPVSPSETSASISSGVLDEGIFLCTLFADGKMISTKRLVKTK